MASTAAPSDLELTLEAQRGDVAALGLVLTRHQGRMLGVAVSLLGYGPDAEDAVQDAAVIAIGRIGEVRDPAAVGAWLRMIVRNLCRARLRAPGDIPTEWVPASTSATPTPEQILDRHAARDWIWQALETLPSAHRVALMLRYFSSVASYEHMAEICEVPIGTVRSRLSNARAKLAGALLETASATYGDAARLTKIRQQEGREILEAAHQGDFGRVLDERWSSDALTIASDGRRLGTTSLLRSMEADLAAGVRGRLGHVVAGCAETIFEIDLISPDDDPEHCPPSVLWLVSYRGPLIQRLRLFHPRKSSAPSVDAPVPPS
ncbi:RNA polymerase sigma factor [Streptomyces sp. NPDC085937]|uniref:RNA polymerase sigma factor n=1 Tax=Streptomyces sp. NPDC085937 TaxID=3365742 RepID=UPI0037D60421